MSFRDWHGRRIIGLGLLWVLALLGIAIGRTVIRARQYQGGHPPDDAYYIISRPPGGAWAVVGPPILLVAIWFFLRRSQSAS
jgi:hypothetical protein